MAGTPNEDDEPSVPKTIYHYCGVESFFGIIRDKELWLSNCRFMNDYAEHVAMIRRADEYLRGLALRGPQDGFRVALRHLMELVPQSPYLACFSSEPDLLSQWRAYAEDGAGFAIGFSTDALKHQCEDCMKEAGVHVSLWPVDYDPSRVFEFLCEKVRSYLANPAVADWRNNDLVGLARRDIWDIAAVSKNRGFREEREWRIVTPPKVTIDDEGGPVAHGGISDRRFHADAKWIVPYFVLKFSPTIVREVRLGPKNYAREREALDTLRDFLGANGYDRKIEIEPSEATYR